MKAVYQSGKERGEEENQVKQIGKKGRGK